MRSLGILGVSFLAIASPARGSGFLLYEQSARAVGLAGAASAGVSDATAVWFDPAALAFAPAAGATIGSWLTFTRTHFDDVASTESPHLVPSLFAHVRLGDRWQAGLGIYAPFGLVISWPEGWVGAEQALRTDLRVIAINPVLAYRVADHLAVAVGASVLRSTVDLSGGLPDPPAGRGVLSGSAWGLAANIALLWRALPDRLQLAVTYRSRAKLPFRGRADFSPMAPGYEDTLPDQRVAADLTLPDLVTAGLLWRPHTTVDLSAQLDWTRWSAFDDLVIDFEEPSTPDRVLHRSPVDPLTVRAGVEWRTPRPELTVRAGASYDQSAARSDTLAPAAPDTDRLGLGAGVGLAHGRFTVDVGYLHVHGLRASSMGPEAVPNGSYRIRAHLIALGFSVR